MGMMPTSPTVQQLRSMVQVNAQYILWEIQITEVLFFNNQITPRHIWPTLEEEAPCNNFLRIIPLSLKKTSSKTYSIKTLMR